jgi:predicted PurR-regulated permease PerM
MRAHPGAVEFNLGMTSSGTGASPKRDPAVDRRRDLERLILRMTVRGAAVIFVMLILVLLAWRLRVILLLVLASLFVAVLVSPFIHQVQRRLHLSRAWATLVVYVVFVAIAASLAYVILSPVYNSAGKFVAQLPTQVREAQHGRGFLGSLVVRFHLANYVRQHQATLEHFVTNLGKPALAVGKTVFSGVTSVITIGFISFFIALEGPGLLDEGMRWLPEERQMRIRQMMRVMSQQVSGFMLGDFATSVIAGIVVFITLEITGVPFASVLAIWVGLVDFLPLVGGLLAGVPTVGVAFLHSIAAGVVTIVVFLTYQQVENHILYPVIVSRTVRLNPLAVLLSVLVGAEIGGIIGSTFGAICGAIFAVPFAGMLQVGGAELWKERFGEHSPSDAAKPLGEHSDNEGPK